jgi:hypothetical protein
MRKILLLIISISALVSCSNNDDDLTILKIRLLNVSPFEFQNIIVNTSNIDVDFKNIKTGEYTEYKAFESAYRYAFTELVIDGKTYTYQPIDYVGETLLENGKYTYQINANTSDEQYGKLSLTLIEE